MPGKIFGGVLTFAVREVFRFSKQLPALRRYETSSDCTMGYIRFGSTASSRAVSPRMGRRLIASLDV